MKARRHDHWPHLLEEALNAARDRPFIWGQHDCCLFVADCVLAMTGDDPAAELRGTYATALEAARILADFGGLAGIAKAKGYEEIQKLGNTHAGDIVYMDKEVEAFGICIGAHSVFLAQDGLTFWPTEQINRAWRV